eukprot:scaffold10606_cov84-Skeletonema_marinoi.AAC.8
MLSALHCCQHFSKARFLPPPPPPPTRLPLRGSQEAGQGSQNFVSYRSRYCEPLFFGLIRLTHYLVTHKHQADNFSIISILIGEPYRVLGHYLWLLVLRISTQPQFLIGHAAKKRARNKNKKAAAATAAATVAAAQPAVEPGRPNAATAPRSQSKSEPQDDLESQIQRQTDDSLPRKDDIKEDVDICVHGLDLQYSNERLKETISVCDDVVSEDIVVIHEVFSGKMPQLESIFGGRESLQNVIDEKLNDLFNGDKAANVDAGIVCTLLAKHPEVCDNPIHFKWIISHFLSEGTQCLLQGDTKLLVAMPILQVVLVKLWIS